MEPVRRHDEAPRVGKNTMPVRHTLFPDCEVVDIGPFLRLIRDEDGNLHCWRYPFHHNNDLGAIIRHQDIPRLLAFILEGVDEIHITEEERQA